MTPTASLDGEVTFVLSPTHCRALATASMGTYWDSSAGRHVREIYYALRDVDFRHILCGGNVDCYADEPLPEGYP